MRYLDRLVHWWRYLAWFDVKRRRDWQAVVWLGVFLVAMAVVMAIAGMFR